MLSIEAAAELHQAIYTLAPDNLDGLIQSISPQLYWARNQPRFGLLFVSRIALGEVLRGTNQRVEFEQGFGCVEVVITATWGGNHDDGSAREGTEVSVHVLDRLAGRMAEHRWHSSGAFGAVELSDAEILPLLNSLLRVPSGLAEALPA